MFFDSIWVSAAVAFIKCTKNKKYDELTIIFEVVGIFTCFNEITTGS